MFMTLDCLEGVWRYIVVYAGQATVGQHPVFCLRHASLQDPTTSMLIAVKEEMNGWPN